MPDEIVQPVVTPMAVAPVSTVQPVVQTPAVVETDQLRQERERAAALEVQNAELRAELAKKATPEELVLSKLAEMDAQLKASRAVSEQLLADAAAAKVETRRAQLQAYMERRLREVGVTDLILEMVGGTNEQEVEASITNAKAEYVRRKEFFYAKYEAEHGASRIATPVSVSAVPTVSAAAVPVVFPVAPNAASVQAVDTGSAGFTEQVSALTSEDAIRSGQYAANRKALLQSVRAGAQPPVGVPFANSPRVAMTVPRFQQPAGNPTGPVQPAQMQVVASNPTPQPQQAPTAHNGVAPVLAVSAVPAPVQGNVQLPPNPNTGNSFDPAAARASAVQAAQLGLHNPAHAGTAAVTSSRLSRHSEYSGVAVQDASFEGPHPMSQRNTAG